MTWRTFFIILFPIVLYGAGYAEILEEDGIYEMILQPGPEEGQDVTIWTGSGYTHDHNGIWLEVGTRHNSHMTFRGVIKFDLSTIPNDAVVTHTELDIYKGGGGAYGVEDEAVGVYQSYVYWDEGTLPPFGSSGVDYNEIPEDIVTGLDDDTQEWQTWSLSNDLVQGWINGSIDNYGIYLINQDEVNHYPDESVLDFMSSDYSNADLRPKLTVTYAINGPPDPPQNFIATPGNQQIKLSWSPNPESDLHKYNIYRDITSPATTLIDSVVASSPPDTFYVDTDVINLQTYYYRITAVDSFVNESDFSNEVSAIPVTPLQQDSLALVALYNSTDGPNWTNNTNWLNGPVSTWYGVTVEGGRVSRLDLNDNNLIGNLSLEIGGLSNITHLILSTNALSGTIPFEIFNLSNLNYLIIGNNDFGGQIPSEFVNLNNLIYLNLGGNNFTGSIPPELGNLSKLKRLSLNSNDLSGSIPPEIGNLNNLEVLTLGYNDELSGCLPSELGNLINLSQLILCNNNFSGSIPPQLGNLIKLTYLDLHENEFSGQIPEELGNLTNLNSINLQHNQLSGSIPPEIGNLVNLWQLILSCNQLTGLIPSEINSMSSLSELFLFSNKLEDCPDLSSLTELFDFRIQDNKMTFEDIEPNMNIANFQYSPQADVGEEIDTTAVAGSFFTISVIVGGTANQYQWYKDGSLISGANDSVYTINSVTLSDSGTYTCDITNTIATELTLHSKPIHVTVVIDTTGPSVPQNLMADPGNQQVTLIWSPNSEPDLHKYNIYRDTSSPAITLIDSVVASSPPDTFYIDTSVLNLIEYYYRITAVDSSNNESDFSNEVNVMPISPLQQDSLALVALYNSTDGQNWINNTNWLIGDISTWYGVTLSENRVVSLKLSNNNLIGTIPPEIGNLNLTALCGGFDEEGLILSYNQLSGSIPPQIENLYVCVLNLSHNELSGSIPPEIGNARIYHTLDLSYNQLSGTIPPEIGNNVWIEKVDLSHNQFSGTIPKEFGNNIDGPLFFFNHNNFSGAVPNELTNISVLSVLEVQNNQLTDLPNFSVTTVGYLKIENNRFTFEDIEPNVGVPKALFTYSPQAEVGNAQEITKKKGESVSFSFNVGGTANQYQWYKDGSVISGANDSVYAIGSVTLSDSGTYTCNITNTIATELILHRSPITLHVRQEDITVEYSFPQQGWYMISLPVIPEDSSVVTLFPTVLGNTAFGWDPVGGVYSIETELKTKYGYWIAIPGATTDQVCGESLDNYTIHCDNQGWYMIGSVLGGTDFSDPDDDPNSQVLSPAFGWDTGTGSYYTTTTLDEKNGYWAAVFGECDLTVGEEGSGSGLSKSLNEANWSTFSRIYGSTPPEPPGLDESTGELVQIPTEYELSQNTPNPFNPETTIRYQSPENGHVSLIIYNMMGQEIKRLVEGNVETGYHEVVWDGRNDLGNQVSSGVYVVMLKAGKYTQTRKILFVQ